ncbi:MAG: CBS domain-containing protein [Anaerolineae bacterium]|nr:CBS domain-containing protein [Anaerolineae bacterium]MDW8068182.1 CBS domain-containing protein [Anaerolineae bacterium]
MPERRVADIYHKGIIFCKPDTPLQEVVQVMADTGIHAIIVAEGEGTQPLGVVSHTDAIAHYGEDLSQMRAADVMSRGVTTITKNAPVAEAARRILESPAQCLLVVDEDGTPLGILSPTDIIREMRGSKWIWYTG